jgi:hypothetical protein
MYMVILRHVRVTIVPQEISNYYILCVGVFILAIVIWHESRFFSSHCHLWPVWIYHILRHNFINARFSETKVVKYEMCVLIVPTNVV